MKLLLISVQILALVSHVFSFPGGAPLKHCGDMLPGHHAMPIDSTSPFSLSAKLDEERVKVTIVSESGHHFKGFLLEARTDANKEEAIGAWETKVTNTKTLDCFDSEDSAVTHHIDDDDHDDHDDDREHHHKHFQNITFTWWPPVEFDQNQNIYFVATVVKKYSEIYMNVVAPFKWVAEGRKLNTISVEEDEVSKNQTEASQKSVNITMPIKDADSAEEFAEDEEDEEKEFGNSDNMVINATVTSSTTENTTSTSRIKNSTLTNKIENSTVTVSTTTGESTTRVNFATTVMRIKEETYRLKGKINEYVNGEIKKFNFDLINASPIHRMKTYYAWLKKSMENMK